MTTYELKPCPFCGVMPHIYWEAWKDISPDAGVWKLEANHKDSCYITHINGTNISGRSSARRLSQLVEWWNHREELFGNSEQLPSARPEVKEIGYAECANAMLKMWIDNVLTDGEYNRIMDKLNAHHNAGRRQDE